MIYVPGYGPSSAKLAVVGEAPGADEERLGRPFVGQSGKMVDDLLRNSGIFPDSVYKTNIVKIRPPGNDIRALSALGRTIEDFLPQLWEELDTLKPNCILAIGNTALKYLTGLVGIEKYRGSIVTAKNGIKTVGTIHPASLLHAESEGMSSWKDLTYIQWDFNRAVNQASSPRYDPPRRDLQVCKSVLQLDRFLFDHRNSKYAALDIETYNTIPICLGIAFNRCESLSVPLFDIIGKSDRPFIWRTLAEFLYSSSTRKIGQNFKFDQQLMFCCNDYQTNFGFEINNFYFDTMLAFRTLYPELPSSLQFIASVMTEEVYWKDEGKEFNPKRDSLDRLLLYNAKDAAVTYECFERELEELESTGTKDFFFERVMPLHDFYRRLEARGILRDLRSRDELLEKYSTIRAKKEEELQKAIEYFGFEVQVIGKKGVRLYNSPQQVANLVYGALNCPARKDTSDDTLSALCRNALKLKNQEPKRRVLELILELRKIHKTIGTYLDAEHFPDGRLRTGVRIALETGRTSTRALKKPVTTQNYGMAFQTITKHGEVGSDLRSQFIADPGYILIEPDLSQAESRVIAICSNDENQVKIFKYGIDIHRLTASWIFERPMPMVQEFYEEKDDARCRELAAKINDRLKRIILDDERQLGKTFRHAGEGGMEKHRASQLTDLSEWRAGELLKLFHRNSPNIQGVYYPEIIKALQQNDRVLINPFGRRRQFLNKWGDELFKEAYRQIPQSTVSDHLKFAMLRIEKRDPEILFLEESHDSFLAEIKDDVEHIKSAKEIITQELETPIDFSLCSLPRGLLTIPCEIKFGMDWEKMSK